MAHAVEPNDKYPVPFNDSNGPEAVLVPDLEVAYPQQPQGGYYAPGQGSSWQQYQQHKAYLQPQPSISAISGQTEAVSPNTGYPSPHGAGGDGPYYPPQPTEEKRNKILGLPVRTFWILVVVLVIILAGGIGGGVAGGMAANNSKTAEGQSQQDTGGEQTERTPPTTSGSSSSPSGTSGGTSTTTSSTQQAPIRTPNTILPPATDNCPRVNNNIISPLNATGQAWANSREDNTPQKFQIHCDRDMSADIRKGTIDIMRVSVSTLEECIEACAGYNFQYNNNAVYGAGRSTAGLCKAVTLSKKSGDYCFLKNGSRFDVVQSQPWLFSSAILVE
ncbi:hypothetical protein QBC44DRAFT_392390 [Cladorrhinum sp. PSN332]|nr:hypothetical protein QBC44DRAFT_392390 [Cladorrhinum sp. PSN332]